MKNHEVRIYCMISWSSIMNPEYTKKFFDSFKTAMDNSPYDVIPCWAIHERDSRLVPEPIAKSGGHIFVLKEELPARMRHFSQVVEFMRPDYKSWLTILDVDDVISFDYFKSEEFTKPERQVILATTFKVDRLTGKTSQPEYLCNYSEKGEVEAGRWSLAPWGKFYRYDYLEYVCHNRKAEIDIALRYPGPYGSEYKLISILYSRAYELYKRSVRKEIPEVTRIWSNYYWYRNPNSLTNTTDLVDILATIQETDDFLKEAVVCSWGAIIISKCKPEEYRTKILEYVSYVYQVWPEVKDCRFSYETIREDERHNSKSYVAQAFLDSSKLPVIYPTFSGPGYKEEGEENV